MVDKMFEEDPKIKIQLVLANAIGAKNSMQNHLGFTPIQLVTGTLPNIPSVLNSDLPALEEADPNAVNNHLNVMSAAGRAFVKAESPDKIKRTLRHHVRTSEECFENGEKVFYKRDGGKRWHGPGKVVGQLRTVIFVIHGSRLMKCTSCRAIKVPLSNASNENSDQTSTDKHVSADMSNLKEDISEDSELDISSESDIDDTESSEEQNTNRTETSIDAIAPRENAKEKFTFRKSSRTRRPPSWLVWETEEAFDVIIPKERYNDPDVVEAEKAELENWIALEAVDWVEAKGQKLILTSWVITERNIMMEK